MTQASDKFLAAIRNDDAEIRYAAWSHAGETDPEVIPELAKHEFAREDAMILARAVVATGVAGDDLDYSAAQQQAMALASIVGAMHLLGFADEARIRALNEALGGLYEAVATDQTYRPEMFVDALRRFEATLPH